MSVVFAWLIVSGLVFCMIGWLRCLIERNRWVEEAAAANRAREAAERELSERARGAVKALTAIAADHQKRLDVERARIDAILVEMAHITVQRAKRSSPVSWRYVCTVSVDESLYFTLPGSVSLDKPTLLANRLAELVRVRALKEFQQ